MSVVSVSERLQELRALVKRLVEEHRRFASDIDELRRSALSQEEICGLQVLFTLLQDGLTEHILVEEFEVYPEIMRRNLFDMSISTIMQQHHDVVSSLGKMELSLRLKNLAEFNAALDELARVLRLHQPAEEEKVFPLAIG